MVTIDDLHEQVEELKQAVAQERQGREHAEKLAAQRHAQQEAEHNEKQRQAALPRVSYQEYCRELDRLIASGDELAMMNYQQQAMSGAFIITDMPDRSRGLPGPHEPRGPDVPDLSQPGSHKPLAEQPASAHHEAAQEVAVPVISKHAYEQELDRIIASGDNQKMIDYQQDVAEGRVRVAGVNT